MNKSGANRVSVGWKVFSIAIIGLALLLVEGGISHWRFERVVACSSQMETGSLVLRNHMECDMMHDALRADVLTALRAGKSHSAPELEMARKDLNEHVEWFRSHIAANEKLAVNPEVMALLKEVTGPLNEYIESAEKITALAATDIAQAEGALGVFKERFEVLEKSMSQISDTIEKANSVVMQASNRLKSSFNRWLWTLTLSGTVFLSLLALVVTRSVPKPFCAIAQDLADTANQITNAAAEVSSSSQGLAEGSSEQAASIEETSASLEEMSSWTSRNSENVQKAAELARQTRVAADNGVTDMQTMIAAMDAIKVSSDEIAKIIKTIDEIAFQTNILALNAAVEAARAGEAGMGFAVVADEVRNLAQRSAQSAKETAAKIESAIDKAGQGVEISGKVAEALNYIVGKVRQVDELAADVARASREQTQEIVQLNKAVGQMDKVTQGNAASAEESAAAAEELSAHAEQMKRSVAELLKLVGCAQTTPAASPSAVTPHLQRTRIATRAVKPAPSLRKHDALSIGNFSR